jgi:hypothetical protein
MACACCVYTLLLPPPIVEHAQGIDAPNLFDLRPAVPLGQQALGLVRHQAVVHWRCG